MSRLLSFVVALAFTSATCFSQSAPADGADRPRSPLEVYIKSMPKWADFIREAEKRMSPEDMKYIREQLKSRGIRPEDKIPVTSTPSGLIVMGTAVHFDGMDMFVKGKPVALRPELSLKQNVHEFMRIQSDGGAGALFRAAIPTAHAYVERILAPFLIVGLGYLAFKAMGALLAVCSVSGPFCPLAVSLAAVLYFSGAKAKSVSCEPGKLTITEANGTQNTYDIGNVRPDKLPKPAAEAQLDKKELNARVAEATKLIENSNCKDLAKGGAGAADTGGMRGGGTGETSK